MPVWHTLGVFHVARSPLALGLEIGRRSFSLDGLSSDATVVQLRVQYCW